jgi:ribosomal protein L40E
MEYTDAPAYTEQADTNTMSCPYCGATLPRDAKACTHCDWTREATKPAEPKASDAMAMLLSIIPGLGHIYKGHRLTGAILLFIVTPLAAAFSLLAGFASAGWGLLMFVPYWIAVIIHVWGIEDRVSPTSDEGEQY